jgi:hypothetical protein
MGSRRRRYGVRTLGSVAEHKDVDTKGLTVAQEATEPYLYPRVSAQGLSSASVVQLSIKTDRIRPSPSSLGVS